MVQKGFCSLIVCVPLRRLGLTWVTQPKGKNLWVDVFGLVLKEKGTDASMALVLKDRG